MEHQTTIPLIPELDEWEFNDRAAALCAVAEGIIHQECCMNGCVKRDEANMCGHPIHCVHFKTSNALPLECTAFDPGCGVAKAPALVGIDYGSGPDKTAYVMNGREGL